MDSEKGDVSVYRGKLDDTLSCNDLSDHQVLRNLVKNQISQSRSDEFTGNVESVVEARTRELSTFLELLRSASSANLERSKSGDMLERSWNMKRDTDEFRVMYREGPVGTPFHELLVEGFVDGPIDVLLCVSWETILYKEWWPNFSVPPFRVVSSDCVKRVRNGEQVASARMKLPWPLLDREALVHYFALEYFEKDLIIVLLNSLSETVDRSTYGFTWEGIPDAADAVRIDAVGGFAHLKVNANRTYFRVIARLDVKLVWVPPSLINFISRQIIASGFKLFKKEVESVSQGNEKFSEYLKDPLYDHIRKALYSRDIEKDEPVVVSESEGSELRQVPEISEVEQNHATDHVSEDRKETPPLSPQVKQALDTLDKVISVLREHNSIAEELRTNTEEESSEHGICSENTIVMVRETDGSSLANGHGSVEAFRRNGKGKVSSKWRKKKSEIAAFLQSRFSRAVE